ncbi:hypothetical protein [Flavobacterium hungaricum]|uniref:hypothetical protein n=1 Tax=Flavobacterium hungaricum TaxID=2082725 RepID=UPI00188028A7|nr:hypothetical protein [Flavobacterium hungaricum]
MICQTDKNTFKGQFYLLISPRIASAGYLFKTQFSMVNSEQVVPKKPNEILGIGIIRNHEVKQTFEDFMPNKNTHFECTLELIEKK